MDAFPKLLEELRKERERANKAEKLAAVERDSWRKNVFHTPVYRKEFIPYRMQGE